MARKPNTQTDRLAALEVTLPAIQASIDFLLGRTDALERAVLLADPVALSGLDAPAIGDSIAFAGASRGLFAPNLPFPCAVSFESTAAEAGAALSRIQDLVARLKRRSDRLGDLPVGPTVGDTRRNLDRRKSELEQLRAELLAALGKARDAKAKVSAAALAGKEFGAAKPHIEAAQESFDAAEVDLDGARGELAMWQGGADRAQVDQDAGIETRARAKLQNAADKIKHDVTKLKDAAAAIN